jgi:helicase
MKESLKISYQDMVGSKVRVGSMRLSGAEMIPRVLREALVSKYGHDLLISPPQQDALDAGVVRKNGKDFLVCAPTNSGKSLIGWLRMFTAAIEGGHRSVYVAPLKALAEEKAAELRDIAQHVKAAGGPPIKVTITTGDYQRTEDFLGSPPPDSGELVICTPERLEVMLRNPENIEWARAVQTYVLDECHLLGDRTRGRVMEILITRLLVSCPWSSLIGLSATMGGVARVVSWLEHTGRKVCLIQTDYRYPQLERIVGHCDSKAEFVINYAGEVFGDLTRSLLVFVSTREACGTVAELINSKLGSAFATTFNAGLSLDQRNSAAAALRECARRCVVTTTSLKMGVNFPVTDVIVFDSLLRGSTGCFPLPLGDILQMMGRAGRGDLSGRATLLCQDVHQAEEYAEKFRTRTLEEILPQLARKPAHRRLRGKPAPKMSTEPLHSIVLTEVTGRAATNLDDLKSFVCHTYSGVCGNLEGSMVRHSVEELLKGKLIEEAEGRQGFYTARKLGRTVALCGLSPESGAMLAGMIRALIRMSQNDRERGRDYDYIGALTDLDLLFLAVSTFECRDRWLPLASTKAVGDLQTFIEALPPEDKPLFNRWRRADSQEYPTRRLLSTLQVPYDSTKQNEEGQFVRILATATLLYRHAKGESLKSLALLHTRGRSIVAEGDLESGLKFSAVWVLSCLAQICDPKKCYDLPRIQLRALNLIEDVSVGSELGKLRQLDGIGRRTIESLTNAGFASFEQIRLTSLDSIRKRTGLSAEKLEMISKYVHRRNR